MLARPRSLILLAALALSACTGGTGSPAEIEQQELASLADDLRLAIDDHSRNCKDMGAAMARWHTANGQRFAELRGKHPTLRGEQFARWGRMLGALNRAGLCMGNPMLGRDDADVKRVVMALEL